MSNDNILWNNKQRHNAANELIESQQRAIRDMRAILSALPKCDFGLEIRKNCPKCQEPHSAECEVIV